MMNDLDLSGLVLNWIGFYDEFGHWIWILYFWIFVEYYGYGIVGFGLLYFEMDIVGFGFEFGF